MNFVVAATLVQLAAGMACANVEDGVSYSGNDVARTVTVSTADACCERCQQNTECFYWSYWKSEKHCYQKNENGTANRATSSGHISGSSSTAPAPPPTPPPAPPASHYRFPYGSNFIVTNDTDGCPDYSLDGTENSEQCLQDGWRTQCDVSGKHSDQNVYYCECGTPGNRSKQMPDGSPCYQCYGFMNALPRQTNSSFPAMKRSQILERALGWIVHGYSYGAIEPKYANRGAPEGCASDDDKNCPVWEYGSSVTADHKDTAVCQDMVKMAWGSNYVPHGSKTIKISCADVKPGDAIVMPGHYQLFRRWMDPETARKPNGRWLIYQMGGEWGKPNADFGKWNQAKYKCYRHPNIVKEDCDIGVESVIV